MKRDPDYTVVSDFSATGKTRGALDPVLNLAGDVLRPRGPCDPMTDVPKHIIPPSNYARSTPLLALLARRANTVRER